jgi:regulator of sirC expression with transglutaminase-like and TPR domain
LTLLFPVRKKAFPLAVLAGIFLGLGLLPFMQRGKGPLPEETPVCYIPPEPDFAKLSLNLDRELFPSLDVEYYSGVIDGLAAKIKNKVGGSEDPLARVMAMNQVIFGQGGYSYDRDTIGRDEAEIVPFNRILESKKGDCFSLEVLYLSVAQRLGYPVRAVAVPGHYFARYCSPGKEEFNIEPTAKGRHYIDSSYIDSFALGSSSIANGSYMRTLSTQEFTSEILANYAVFQMTAGNPGRAKDLLEGGLAVNPGSVFCMAEISKCYGQLSSRYKALCLGRGYVDKAETPIYKKMMEEEQ